MKPFWSLRCKEFLRNLRKFFEEATLNSLPVTFLKPFATYYEDVMKGVVLPMTFKQLQSLSQQHTEKHCRLFVQQHYSAFASTPTQCAEQKQPGESNLERYLKQLHPEAGELAAAFCSHLARAEPGFVALYEATVAFRVRGVVRKPGGGRVPCGC